MIGLGIDGISDIKHRTDGRYWSHVHKFGSNGALSGSQESIWSSGGLYPWSALDNPEIIYVSSSNPADGSTLTIEGLGSNWQVQKETVDLGGSPSEVASTLTFRRVYRMTYDAVNVGVISAKTVSHAGTVVAQIPVGKAQTLLGVYTVPAGCIGYLIGYNAGVGKLDDALIELYVREGGVGPFRIKSEMSVYQAIQQQNFRAPLRLDPKTDIDFRATGSSGNSVCTANFDIILHNYLRDQ